jgi:serine/threonine protein phosphatase PrpC
MKILCAAKQILGERKKQEDTIQCLSLSTSGEDESLLLLADGMGGYVGGDKASQLIVNQFIASYQSTHQGTTKSLKQSLSYANTALATAVAKQPEFTGMGSTLLVAHVNNKQLHWLSVGDSPFWLYRNAKLIRLNQDHSMASIYAKMVKLGQMSEESAANEPLRHSLRSVVTGEKIPLIDAPEKTFELLENDILLLASDGLETLTTPQISAILQQHQSYDMEVLANELLATVSFKNNPNQDNASVIVYKVASLLGNKTNFYSSIRSWFSRNSNLLIIIAFGLSSLLAFFLLQSNPPLKKLSFKIPTTSNIQRLQTANIEIKMEKSSTEFDVQSLLKKENINAEHQEEIKPVIVEMPETFNQ